LATDPRTKVQLSAVSHWRCPLDTFDGVLASAGEDTEDAIGIKETVASSPRLRGALLERLARDPRARTRAAVAGHADLPKKLLESLRADRRPTVRAALAMNPTIPDAVLNVLAKDENPGVVRRVREARRLRTVVGEEGVR
jgi:hypothetical protein